jgi:hypothetical protein
MSNPQAPLIVEILDVILKAEPAIVTAVHNLLAGTGSADDIAVLKADSLSWQALADRAQQEIAKLPPSAASA